MEGGFGCISVMVTGHETEVTALEAARTARLWTISCILLLSMTDNDLG